MRISRFSESVILAHGMIVGKSPKLPALTLFSSESYTETYRSLFRFEDAGCSEA